MKQKRMNKLFLALAMIVCILVFGVSGTLAFIAAKSPSVENVFEPGDFSIDIEETFTQNIKEDVKIRNSGDGEAYVRAMVVVTWRDEQGNVFQNAPVENRDYTMEWGGKSKWINDGEYYYYTSPLAPGASTDPLIERCTEVTNQTPSGYRLYVDILAGAIQSRPSNVVGEVWKSVSADADGNLSASGT